MSITNQIYDESATKQLKYSAIAMVVGQVVSFILGLTMYLTGHVDDALGNYIDIIGALIFAIAWYLLGTSMHRIGMSYPFARTQAAQVKTWFYILAGAVILVYIPIVGGFISLVVLIATIVGLVKLNKLFSMISDATPQQGRLNSWVIIVYAFAGLISVGLAIVAAFVIVFTGIPLESAYVAGVIIAGGIVLIAAGFMYVIYKNSKKLELIRQSVDFSQLAQKPAPGVIYQPLEPAKPIQTIAPVQGTKFCSTCGEKLIDTDKFCPGCGAELSSQ